MLAEIAQEVGQQANVSAKGDGGAAQSGPATGADGGQAYRDPFDPDFWTKQVQVSSASKKANEEQSAKSDQSPKGEVIALSKATAADAGQPADQPQTPEQQPTVSEQQTQGSKQDKQTQQLAKASAQSDASMLEDNAALPQAKDIPPTKAQQQEAKDLQQAIQAEIKGVAGQLAEGLQVTAAEGGVLVTISDQSNDPMFNIGSAVPRREMVLAMEKIGKILAEHKGSILIRGHTDGRPYMVGGRNDNWRLSLDRAQSAYYMLTSGGLDEKRIAQVSGFADRRLKLPADPFNDANRRIEILIATPADQAVTDPQTPAKPAPGKVKPSQGKQG